MERIEKEEKEESDHFLCSFSFIERYDTCSIPFKVTYSSLDFLEEKKMKEPTIC